MSKRMPALFVGHGDPMLALKDNDNTRNLKKTGEYIIDTYGKPKAILIVSAHWYKGATYVQSDPKPKQVFDMYGFPKELYEVKYEPAGYKPLTDLALERLDTLVSVNDEWGIDHGVWTPLVHLFPKADIPVVELSVNGRLDPEGSFLMGRVLGSLRDEGYLVMGSGNVVHNLREVDWNNPKGTYMADEFDRYIKEAILAKDYQKVIDYKQHKYAKYAVPTPDHYLPIVYMCGAGENNKVTVFNDMRELGSMSMTSYLFEDE